MTTTAGHRTSEVSAATGFSASALRYYEGVGLIEPDRSPSGYRIYDDRAIERLHFMARAKDLGLTLDEISELLPTWEDDQCADVAQRLATSVTDRIAATRQRIAELTAFASDLERTAHTLTHDVTDGPCGDACSCTPRAPDLDTRIAVVLGPEPKPDSHHDPAPIVCTLSAGGPAERVDQWAQLIAARKATPHRRTDDRTASVTVRFPPDPTLAAYGFTATLQEDANFGRILAAYGGIFVAGSLAWGMAVDGFRPNRYDLIGATICLIGVAVIMFAPRPT